MKKQARMGTSLFLSLLLCGCSTLLIRQSDTALPVFDTTRIHAERAAALALES